MWVINLGTKYIPTGNEFVSLPCINEDSAGIEDFTVLHMNSKGMLDFRSDGISSLIEPFVVINGKKAPLLDIKWKREEYWIPAFTARNSGLDISGSILAPVGERGFIYRLTAANRTEDTINIALGIKGLWHKTMHSVNEDKEITGEMHAYDSAWNEAVVFDLRVGLPLMAFAPMSSLPAKWNAAKTNNGISYEGKTEHNIQAGGEVTLDFFWGVGFEEVAAVTSAKEMLRQTFDALHSKTLKWLRSREKSVGDSRLNELLNTNLFFNYFFATGITIDTEDLVLVTSRSPRYYVSAAYWDRDSLLWSFPSILMIDAEHARKMLDYVFTRQIRNSGVHSRYIDGTVLEPGFELDELCALVLALARYVARTGDRSVLSEPHIEKGVKHILKILESKHNHALNLYETFLQPTDDMMVYPYITYDNVLVWRALTELTGLYSERWDKSLLEKLTLEAQNVEAAIYKHCIKEYEGRRIFAWSVDEQGNWDVYDEPPGSLQLLPHMGFCDSGSEIWRNTVEVIRNPNYAYSFAKAPFSDIGCPHAPHPWILSVGNSLLCGRFEEAKSILLRASMDNGIACESIDEFTGECATGAAFATCAGFLTYCIMLSLGDNND